MTQQRSTTLAIQPLSRHPEYEIVDEALDVRGWEVTSPAFATVGVVQDLLVDTIAGKVRYLDIALSADTGRAGQRLLLPIGKALLDDALDRVVIVVPSCLDALTSHGSADLTELTREDEQRVLAAYGVHGSDDEDFYACPAFDDSGFAHRRNGDADCGRRDEDEGAACAIPTVPAAAPVVPGEDPPALASIRDAAGQSIHVNVQPATSG